MLTENLQGVPHLILPVEPEGARHNWYNYTLRFDMESLGTFTTRRVPLQTGGGDAGRRGRHGRLAGLHPAGDDRLPGEERLREGAAPWDCPHAAPVDYSLERFPVAQRHCDTHTGMTVPLRPPNGPEVARLTAAAIRKVMENVEELQC